jgi:tetratricopeptide (TPR) repeat protein
MAMPATDTIAAALNRASCNDEWDKVLKQSAKVEDRLRNWSALSAKCGNSGIYEPRLGTLYTQAGQYDKARAVVESGLTLKTPYRKELLSTLAGVDLSQQNLSRALERYESMVKSYPDWYDGYSGVGAVKLMQGKFEDAVRYLSEAAKREKRIHIYRNLTIAYHQLGKNEEAVRAINAAYKLDQELRAIGTRCLPPRAPTRSWIEVPRIA